MKHHTIIAALIYLFAAKSLCPAQTHPTIQLVNPSSQNAQDALNTSSSFTTNYRGVNDVKITMLSGSIVGYGTVDYRASNPGNNPPYITQFVGQTGNGTGNGLAGYIPYLDMNIGTSLQFDFSIPLTANDRLLAIDLDNNEVVTIQAFSLVGSNYIAVSLASWTHEPFTGSTGIQPDSQWATWNGVDGVFSAGPGTLTDPLNVLTPSQTIDRIIFTSTSGAGRPSIEFLHVPEPNSSGLFALSALIASVSRRHRKTA